MQQAAIYVVEDDDAGREALLAWLTARGCQARGFPSADSFLNNADLNAPGCVISDFRMPGMNGTELQAELHKRNSILPVIIVSGYADVPIAVRAMQQGAVTLLEKPYQNDELLEAIHDALERDCRRRQQIDDANEVRKRLSELSTTQSKVMQLLVAGRPNKAVANQLSLGLRTVERHRQQILQTMHVESLPELATLLASVEATPEAPAS